MRVTNLDIIADGLKKYVNYLKKYLKKLFKISTLNEKLNIKHL